VDSGSGDGAASAGTSSGGAAGAGAGEEPDGSGASASGQAEARRARESLIRRSAADKQLEQQARARLERACTLSPDLPKGCVSVPQRGGAARRVRGVASRALAWPATHGITTVSQT